VPQLNGQERRFHVEACQRLYKQNGRFKWF
jgi:hypothetical protein